jgi:integrase
LSNYYLSTVRVFLRYLFENQLTEQDYSYIVPSFRRPQPLPSVYSAEEIRRIEYAIGTTSRCCKRNYAMVLLATRLGIRNEDIVLMAFDDLDFTDEYIRITQKKTETPLLLPMLPDVKAAVLEYISLERTKVESSYVFLKRTQPYTPITSSHLSQMIRRVVKAAGINPEGRKIGARAFRSSLASSMINDNIPYDAVRKVLGHSSKNAIKSYARLDIEQLRRYALEVPAATGAFADFLNGRKQK